MIISNEQLSEILISSGIINSKGIQEIQNFAKETGVSLTEGLIEKSIITDENLGLLIANHLKIPYINLTRISIPDDVLRIIPEKLAKKKKTVAFARNEKEVKVAMVNPLDAEFISYLKKKTNAEIICHLATEIDIKNALYLYKKDLQTVIDNLLKENGLEGSMLFTSDAPIGKILDLLIEDAYQNKASDIHIEPQELVSLIRFRIDGILHDELSLPKVLHDRVVTRIKILAKLRTDEHLSPQDGKIRMRLEDDNLDIRVSIVPIVDGEKVVMRLLTSHFRQLSLAEIGLSGRDLRTMTNAIQKPYGMILSTGPTGSGKTTAIYTILKILNQKEKNITTIEDPVEYRIKGVNQIQVNPKANLTFASGLRSILRQDPNVVFVGEIRDKETAGIAVNAALTGHLVLSTLHTNDAATALPRLMDMDVEPYIVASTVNVIVALRLVRKICDMCKSSYSLSLSSLIGHIPQDTIVKNFGQAQNITVFKGIGCKLCHFTGYSSRIGIFEVLEVTKNLKRQISEAKDSEILKTEAIKEGMTTMLDDGLQKAKQGLTTVEEVLRVTKVESV